MRLFLPLTFFSFFAVMPLASAQNFESMQLAQNLGDVLASEKLCGLTYDQAAIQAFIEQEVSADDLGFTSMLSTMTQGAQFNHGDLSPSAKTAHCSQITRVAKHYGFTK